jgi:hypothetical protein
MIKDKVTQQNEHYKIKHNEYLLIYRFPKLDWEVFYCKLANNQEVS